MTNHEIEIVLWVSGAIGISSIIFYFVLQEQVKEAFKEGSYLANKDLTSAWDRGYAVAISYSKYREKQGAQKAGQKHAKTPVNQPAKPSNNGRASVAVNKQKLPPPPPPPAPRLQNEFGVPVKASRKPVAKKPVKGAKAK